MSKFTSLFPALLVRIRHIRICGYLSHAASEARWNCKEEKRNECCKNSRQEKFISVLSACQLFDDCQTPVAENFHCFLSRLLIPDCLDYEWWFQECTHVFPFVSFTKNVSPFGNLFFPPRGSFVFRVFHLRFLRAVSFTRNSREMDKATAFAISQVEITLMVEYRVPDFIPRVSKTRNTLALICCSFQVFRFEGKRGVLNKIRGQ